MSLTRRDFLWAGAASFTAFLAPAGAPRIARSTPVDPVLVALFLRGAADGLNLVVPHGDPGYYDLRPTIRVPPGSELDLDGFYGFHPALAPLLPLFQSGELAVIHAVGSPHETRSHFDAQHFMETAVVGDRRASEGWLNRCLTVLDEREPIAGITLDFSASRSLRGPGPNLAFPSIGSFDLNALFRDPRRRALEALYGSSPSDPMARAAASAFAAIDSVSGVQPAGSVAFPGSAFGRAMRDVAALVKAQIGVRVVAVQMHGWDLHTDEATRLGPVAGELGETLAAFHADLGAFAPQTLTLAMTEFGRTAWENGGRGTDHGHGSAMIVLGGGIAGGRVLTAGDAWPGLAPESLDRGRDLAVTTDFRDVFAEVLDRHMGLADPGAVLTGFDVDPAFYPGLFA